MPRIDWMPNHILIIHILLLFSTLNPLVIPFGLFYFTISASECFPCFVSLHTMANRHSSHSQELGMDQRLYHGIELIYMLAAARLCKTLRGERSGIAYPNHPLLSRWQGDLNQCYRQTLTVALRSHPLPSRIFGVHGGE